MTETVSHVSASAGAITAKPTPVREFAVVIVSYHTGPSLWECLTAVIENPSASEIILVDNGNPEDVARKLAELESSLAGRLMLIQGHGNIGFGRACNLAGRAAKADHIVFLNPDAILEAGALAAFDREFARHASHPLLLGGRLLTGRGEEQRGARRGEITLWSAFVTFSGLGRLGRFLPIFRDAHLEGLPMADEAVPMPVVSGALMSLNRASFEALDGFDEGYFLHVEDIDLCRRVREAGGQVIFVPDAVAKHYGSTSKVGRLWLEMEKAKGLNRYFRKFARGPFGWLAARLLGPFVTLAMWVRAVLLLRRERARIKAWPKMRETVSKRRDSRMVQESGGEIELTAATISVTSAPSRE